MQQSDLSANDRQSPDRSAHAVPALVFGSGEEGGEWGGGGCSLPLTATCRSRAHAQQAEKRATKFNGGEMAECDHDGTLSL